MFYNNAYCVQKGMIILLDNTQVVPIILEVV